MGFSEFTVSVLTVGRQNILSFFLYQDGWHFLMLKDILFLTRQCVRVRCIFLNSL